MLASMPAILFSNNHWTNIFHREVALNMLLRLTEHSRIVVLLTHVLEFYKRKKARWQEVCQLLFIGSIRECI